MPTTDRGAPPRIPLPDSADVPALRDQPLSKSERHATARLLEAIHEALCTDMGVMERASLVGFLRVKTDAAAMALWQGNRAHLLDQLTGELDRFHAELTATGEGGR